MQGPYEAYVAKLRFDARTGTLELAYSTYLGGSDGDLGNGIAVDPWGSVYVTGITGSSDFPLAHPVPTNRILRAVYSAFVSKLSFDDRTGILALAYSTYLGGNTLGTGYGIATDTCGNAYVTGATESSDFPLAHPLPTNSVLRGFANAFVSKLSFDARSGVLQLAYSSYLGGSGFERGAAIAVDDWGNAYVTGSTSSADFPLADPLVTSSAPRGTFEAFVSKLSFDARTTTLALAYSTYLGGSTFDEGNGIGVDRWGNAYVVGTTASPDFPLSHPLPNNIALRGNETAFVSKLSFDARTASLALAYSTFLGGSTQDEGFAIAVDSQGDAYLTGRTDSSDFPLVHPVSSNRGFHAAEAFAVKIGVEPFECKNRAADQNR